MRELALFAGGAGGILGTQLVGFRTVYAVENDPACIESLLRRQKDGCLPTFPIWDDVRTFDGRHWKGDIEVVTGGFPCTNISSAGTGDGITGKDSRLFFEMLRIIEEVRPRFVFAENSPQLRTKGLGAVLAGFASLGYDAQWGVLGARHIGADHWRRRMWIVATDSNWGGKRVQSVNAEMARAQAVIGVASNSADASVSGRYPTNPNGKPVRKQQGRRFGTQGRKTPVTRVTDWWDIPRFTRVDDGCSNRLDIEKAITKMEVDGMEEEPRNRNARVIMTGNMQVPIVAATAWRILTDG